MNNLIYQSLKIQINKIDKELILKNDIPFVKELDEFYFTVYLDLSGFNIELVQQSLVELENYNRKWKSTGDSETYIGLIVNSTINEDRDAVCFHILKSDFRKFLEVNNFINKVNIK